MVSDPIYLYKLLETKNARLQAFFWYRHTWLILSVLTLMLDTSNQKVPEPKLKLNNNLVTALAALDKVLQTSTDSDDDAEKDFV